MKLATFGDVRTEARCLRHDGNVKSVYGAEADYDGEAMGFDEAVARIRDAGIAAILYTSPSHTPAKPRWMRLSTGMTDWLTAYTPSSS